MNCYTSGQNWSFSPQQSMIRVIDHQSVSHQKSETEIIHLWWQFCRTGEETEWCNCSGARCRPGVHARWGKIKIGWERGAQWSAGCRNARCRRHTVTAAQRSVKVHFEKRDFQTKFLLKTKKSVWVTSVWCRGCHAADAGFLPSFHVSSTPF